MNILKRYTIILVDTDTTTRNFDYSFEVSLE